MSKGSTVDIIGVKSGHSDAHKPVKLGLRCKANKGSDVATGYLGMQFTHEKLPLNITTLLRVHQTTASLESDTLASPSSVSNRQAEPLLLKYGDA